MKVHRLLVERTVKQWSFAYQVIRERPKDGVNILEELDLIEVGPTLQGANPATRTLVAKALGLKEGRRNSAKDAELLNELGEHARRIVAIVAELTAEPEPPASDGKGRKAAPLSGFAAQVAAEMAAFNPDAETSADLKAELADLTREMAGVLAEPKALPVSRVLKSASHYS